MRLTEYRFRALTDGWFAALDNLYARSREQELTSPRSGSRQSVRGHQFELQINLFKEQRQWVRIGEEIGLFPPGSATRLDRHYLLEGYSDWLDPNLRSSESEYATQLRDPEYFTRAYSRALSGLTATQLERTHLTHFASEEEWQLALTEIQVLRAMAVVHPRELSTGEPIDQYNMYWFMDWYEAPEEETPSSWRNGGYWPGANTAMRLDVLRDQFTSFEPEFMAAVLGSSDEGWIAGPDDSASDKKVPRWFKEEELLSIAREEAHNLQLIRERIILLLEGMDRDRVKP